MGINTSNDIKAFISEIAEKLWTGHASIMIGAGFSKNANKANSSVKSFPNWTELGDIFYEKLNAKKPIDSDRAYLNVLKLADEIEATFGKDYMNKLIKNEIPDKEYIPSELHVKLLSLPWKDVFTTNYDTLLERSADQIIERRYDIVTKTADLVWSTSPRIIKLHGSIGSARPFIISGEDYRQYPNKYAPFVNTVQQSLLENTLCLIGFSGDDPNFINWIGWIRDNLGKENSPKIYMIGVHTISHGQKRLLDERNIIYIDLFQFYTDIKNQYKAISLFIKELNELNNSNPEDWLKNDIKYIDSRNNIYEIHEAWKNLRNTYPGWLILPSDKRESLLNITDSINLSVVFINKFSPPNDLFFLFEFNWRIEKGLQPLYNAWEDIYKLIIEKYNPFHEKLNIEGSITKLTNIDFDWIEIQNAWIALQFGLLRLYREEGWNEKWNTISTRLDILLSDLSAEQLARYYYEKCLFYAYNFDLDTLKENISNWPIDMSMPYWEAKRATLIAEFDSTVDAVKILESALKEVRSRLNLSPIRNNYSLVSMESYLMLLHRLVSKADEMRQSIYQLKFTDNYQQRWQDIKKYECNPWDELRDFELQMQTILNVPKRKEKIASFDIGRYTNVYRFGANSSYRLAWSYFMFLEEIGLPYHLPNLTSLNNTCFKNALSVIADSSAYTANVAMIRYGDSTLTNSIYNRALLTSMNKDQVTTKLLQYSELLKQTILHNQSNNNINITLSRTLPDIISRLCSKATYESRIKLLSITYDIYIKNIVSSYNHIDILIERLVKSFSAEEQYQLIPRFLDFPIYFDQLKNGNYDPFNFINVIIGYVGVKINKEYADDLIRKLLKNDYTRTIAHSRLVILYRYNLLNRSQLEKMAINSWKQLNSDGFPAKTKYYNCSFLGLPYPKNVNPFNLLRKYISETSFPINSKKGDNSFGFHLEDFPIFRNILGTYDYKENYNWTSEEIDKLISNILEWWDADKHYLLNNKNIFGRSISEEFKDQFYLVKEIIVSIISYNSKHLRNKNIDNIRRIIKEIPQYNIYNLEIRASLISVFNNYHELEAEIIEAISSDNNDRMLDGINAVSELIYNENNISNLIDTVTSNFRCGKKEGLTYTIDCIISILSKWNKEISLLSKQNIELGLLYMISYTRISIEDSENEINSKLDIVKLIIQVLVFYRKVNNNSIALNKWESIINNENEFLEIINHNKNSLAMYAHKLIV